MPAETLKAPLGIVGFGVEGEAALQFVRAQSPNREIVIFDERNVEEAVRAIDRTARVEWGSDYLAGLRKMRSIIRSPGVRPELLQPYVAPGALLTSPTNLFFAHSPAPIIGVTGTKGKGTTATLIAELLRAGLPGKTIELVGNIGPPALDRLAAIRAQDLVVFELSSFQLVDIQFSPHIAVVLDISADHLNWHPSVRDYRQAKRTIVMHQKPSDYAVINSDYLHAIGVALYTPAQIWWFSRRHFVDRGAYIAGEKLMLVTPKQHSVVTTRQNIALPGVHNLENIAAATTVGAILGVGPAVMRSIFRRFRGLEHRLEFLRKVRGITLINDSFATTPEGTSAAIAAFPQPKVLILGGSDKGASFGALAQKIIEGNVRGVVAVGQTAPRMSAALLSAGFRGPLKEGAHTMQEIVSQALGMARAGDIVVLSPGCASFGLFRDAKDRGRQFKEVVRELA